MKKILIPTDFSTNATNAISYAMEFFKNVKCTFYFLHTYTPAFYRMDYMLGGPAYSAIPDVGIDISLAGLEKTLEDVKKQFSNPRHSYKTLSAFNILTDEVNEMANKENIDMVVMGTQGATGAKEIFLGTNTVYVIRKAKIPVLAIPDNYRFKEINKILFPTDYGSHYEQEDIGPVTEIAKMHKAKLTVLHVMEEEGLTDEQESNKEFLAKSLKGTEHVFKDIRESQMPDAIHEYIHANDFDMLAMMKRKHSFLERLLVKQNVDAIGFHIKIPFLVMRDTAKVVK